MSVYSFVHWRGGRWLDGFTPALQPANLRGVRVLRRQARQQSISRARSSKPAAAVCGRWIMGQTDKRTGGRTLAAAAFHRPGYTYYVHVLGHYTKLFVSAKLLWQLCRKELPRSVSSAKGKVEINKKINVIIKSISHNEETSICTITKEIYTKWVKKTRHRTLAHNFTKYWPIFKILSLLDSVGNL